MTGVAPTIEDQANRRLAMTPPAKPFAMDGGTDYKIVGLFMISEAAHGAGRG